jgi:hypothetical protein
LAGQDPRDDETEPTRFMASTQTSARPSPGLQNPLTRVAPTSLLLAAASCLLAQEGTWNYHPATDMLSDLRNDEAWTNAVAPAAPVYQLAIACEDTEYVSVLVRSDVVIASDAPLAVRFNGGAEEVLPVWHSLASSKRFAFEPGGPALRRMLASRTMAFSLRNGDLQEVSLQFNVAGLEAVMKQMPLKSQQRFAELLVTEKAAPRTATHSRKSS